VLTNSQNESLGNALPTAAKRRRTEHLQTGSNIYSLKKINRAASLGVSYASMSLRIEQMDMLSIVEKIMKCQFDCIRNSTAKR
jgi:hypothetical protein